MHDTVEALPSVQQRQMVVPWPRVDTSAQHSQQNPNHQTAGLLMQNMEAEGDPRHGQPTDMTFQVLLSLGFGPLAPNKGVESMSTRKTRMENPKLVRMHTFISEILLQQ